MLDESGHPHRRQARDRAVMVFDTTGAVVEMTNETRLIRGDRFLHAEIGTALMVGVEVFPGPEMKP